MKLDFLKHINVKLVLLHCLAGFFLTFAISLIGYINDIELVNFVQEKGVKAVMNKFTPERLSCYMIWFGLVSLIGVLISTMISFIFFLKKNLFWIHSVIVFVVLFGFNYFGFFTSHKPYFAYLMNFGLVVNVIVTSSILLIFAIIVYYYSFRIFKKESNIMQ